MVATTVIEVESMCPMHSVDGNRKCRKIWIVAMHQLRGRVGRGAAQSYCILLTGYKLATETRKRMETLIRSNDGFEIAEADLQLRVPRYRFGTQQSGMPFELKLADLAKDGKMLK